MPPKKKTINFNIQPFHMSMVSDNKKICFLGKTNSGKSICVVDYLYYHQDIPIVSVICPTEKYNKTYYPHIPSMLIYDDFNINVIHEFLDRQKNIVKMSEENTSIDPRAILIMDDCLADSEEWVNDKKVKWIFQNGRHTKITCIVVLQYPMGMPPKLRNDIQWTFLFRHNSLSIQKKYYDHYASVIPSFDMFLDIYIKCTEDKGCLVINNESLSTNPEDSVFYYKADINKPNWNSFKLCYKELWLNNDIICKIKEKNEENEKVNSISKYKKSSVYYNINKEK